MTKTIFISDTGSSALSYAAQYLRRSGWTIANEPGSNVTHLLLPIPSRITDQELNNLLRKLPENVTVIGGNLNHFLPDRNRVWDLLQDESYLADNAAITAHCALQVAAQNLPVILNRQSVLILGWGRIGKCLAQLLAAAGNQVTIAARKEKDRAMARSLMFDAIDPSTLAEQLEEFRVIFNTIPAPILMKELITLCRPDCTLFELASVPGMDSDRAINARGLPGKLAPESSGNLIGQTILRLSHEKEGS